MFRRNIISKLEAWKQDKKHKPLILRGARQVGKTTVVNEFGSQFDNYLYFNLERNENAKLFEMEIPLDDLVNMLYASVGKVKKEGTTLVFIDEIQNSPKTIALLRYFYEQRPDLYVIAAGSLLENLVDVKVSFPVGRVQYLALRPCSFSEFLGAIGKYNLLAVLSQKAEYTVAFHEQLMHLSINILLWEGCLKQCSSMLKPKMSLVSKMFMKLWCKPIRMILKNTSEAIS